MLDAKEHADHPMVAFFQCKIQHVLQRLACLYRRLARKGKRQQGQLYRAIAPLHRWKQKQQGIGKGQLRPGYREMPKGDKASQYKETPGMEQVKKEDRQRH